ncbi:hypothetical protein [Paenibacillus sp. SN-8-1]|uniref:hypothetical protein n=1 Tax=Paenibacillus sp. SN-8-1 TaxID=3435409 RepID=UPI003D9A15A1
MAPGMTNEEGALIKDYVMLPLIISAFQRDSKIIGGAVKTPDVYTDWLTVASDRVTKDLAEVRRQFRQRGIKVYETENDGKSVTARYLCRGYTGEASYLWSFLAAEASVVMRRYLGLDTSKFVDPTIPKEMRRT